MSSKLISSKKFWKNLILICVVSPVLLLVIAISLIYSQQDKIVQELLTTINKDFKGSLVIKDSHISLFANFPYISIDLEDVVVLEDKTNTKKNIVNVKDLYLGFDLWAIISGKMEIKKLTLKNGLLNIIQHADGEFNIAKALSPEKKIESVAEEFHLHLNKIVLENIEIKKLNEANNILIDLYINKAESKFKTTPEHLFISLNSKFMMSVIANNDTTFIKHKHFETNTEIDYLPKTEVMKISPTIIKLEGAEFNLAGTIDFLNDVFVDINLNGNKPNFDLFMAMAPEELIPVLKKYDNKGKVYFDASIKGKSINGNYLRIDATFGCEDAYFNNTAVNKKVDDLNFKGSFTTGEKGNASTMEFNLEDFSAKPEAGTFSGKLNVKNFESPDIQLQLKSDFELEFLAKFFNLTDLKDYKGKVILTMNFRDVVDLSHPEKSIEKLNESYYSELKIENLSFKASDKSVPIKNFNLYAELKGHEVKIKYANLLMGNSDISISGSISDFPAIIHHTAIPVTTKIKINSKYLDVFELTGSDSAKSVNEQISNLALDFNFKSSAKALAESGNLPVGEFFIENLYAKLKHYPHTLHDFHADVFIDKDDLKIVDFKGMIDKSDFAFSGKLHHYNLWFNEHPIGDTKIDFNFNSTALQLHDLFTYKGENFVPADYRHEEFNNLFLHGFADLTFKDGIKSVDLNLDKFSAKMKIHPLPFENFKGRIHYEDEHLVIQNFSGKIGNSDFKTSLNYYLGKNEEIKKRDNHFELTSNRLDLDQLLNYKTNPKTSNTTNHDSVFNIYQLPFTLMTFDINIKSLNYHKYQLSNIHSKLRSMPNHYIYIDKMKLDAAGGNWDIGGYLNASNSQKIYFSPNIKLTNIDLDKFLFKFDNFGQDHLVSENLHGKFSGTITGKIHMHTDLTPKIDDSEIHLDMNVYNGSLNNFAMFDHVSDYFQDKNLKHVRFDTLSNHLDLINGTLTIPNMTINSSIGFMQVEGKQDINFNMEYYLRIPWRMVTQSVSSKLFGKKTEEVDPTKVDAIQYADPQKNVKYLNVKILGNLDNYKVSLGGNKNGINKN